MRLPALAMCGSAGTGDGTADGGFGTEAIGDGLRIEARYGSARTGNAAVVAESGFPDAGDRPETDPVPEIRRG
jgi:hypothetical protein